MPYGSQGIIIRRESSVVGSTGAISTNTISYDAASKEIRRQAGFGDFVEGMRLESNAPLNKGVYTIQTTDTTHITVYETLVDQASGVTITLTGHTMQNIGQIVSFNGPALNANVIDVTNLLSTAKEKIVGVYDGGQLSISVLLDNEASNANLHDALMRDLQARTKRVFDIKFVDSSAGGQPSFSYFEGYLTGMNISGAVDNALKADITIAISCGVDFQNAT